MTEKTTSAFVMGDSGDAASLFHANYGVRIVRTQLTVDGAETNPNGSTFVGTASWNGVNANDVPFDKQPQLHGHLAVVQLRAECRRTRRNCASAPPA